MIWNIGGSLEGQLPISNDHASTIHAIIYTY